MKRSKIFVLFLIMNILIGCSTPKNDISDTGDEPRETLKNDDSGKNSNNDINKTDDTTTADKSIQSSDGKVIDSSNESLTDDESINYDDSELQSNLEKNNESERSNPNNQEQINPDSQIEPVVPEQTDQKTEDFDELEIEKQRTLAFANSIDGYYWYLDGYKYAYLFPTIVDWYDHTMMKWDSKYISMQNEKFVMSEDNGVRYVEDSNLHNSLMMNPTELGGYIIEQHNMKVSESKLFITVGGKSYSFSRRSSVQTEKTTFSLSHENITLEENSNVNVIVTINEKYLWYSIVTASSNPSVADCSVPNSDSSGVLKMICKGYNSGTSIITVKDEEGGSTENITISVKKEVIPVTAVSLNSNSLNLTIGSSSELIASVSPSNASNKDLTWDTSDSSVATVSSDGNVTAVGIGTAEIVVKTIDGEYSDSSVINVTNPPLDVKASAGISILCSSSGCGTYTYININASGGTGDYTYNYDVYRNNEYLGTFTEKETYLSALKGTYEIHWSVTDSSNIVKSGVTISTIS